MRDEDLKNLPQSIERWKFLELLEGLGFGPEGHKDLRGFVVSTDAVRAVVYATDENGHRMLTRRMDEIPVTEMGKEDAEFVEGEFLPEAMMHEICIPFVGKWKRPDEDARLERMAVALYDALVRVEPDPEDPSWPPESWDAEDGWKTLLVESEREEYRKQARRLVAKLGLPAVP